MKKENIETMLKYLGFSAVHSRSVTIKGRNWPQVVNECARILDGKAPELTADEKAADEEVAVKARQAKAMERHAQVQADNKQTPPTVNNGGQTQEEVDQYYADMKEVDAKANNSVGRIELDKKPKAKNKKKK